MATIAKNRIRRGTAAGATANNPLLLLGELGYETDTDKMKIGDGVTLWNAKVYIPWSEITSTLITNWNTAFTNSHPALTIGTASGLSIVAATQVLSLATAAAGTTGALTGADWTTFNNKEAAITAGTNLQYYRGDKTMQTLDSSVVPENTNLYYTDVRADARITLQKAAANGLATLDVNSKIPSAQLPALAITDTFVVASQAAMLLLTAQTGDVAVRTDQNKSYILQGTDPTVLGDWQELLTPTDSVLSVNGYTGAITLTTSDITEGTNLYYTNARVNTVLSTWTGSTSVTTLGTIATGTWQGTSIATTYTDAKIVSVTGTANRITIGGTATAPTFDISASYAGQTSITTIGTIASAQLLLGTGTMVFPASKGVRAFSSSGGNIGFDATNTLTSSYMQLLFAETTSNYGGFFRWNTAYPGNYTGTSLAFANSFQVQSGNGNERPLVLSATPLIYNAGVTSTNFGFRADATGLRLGLNSNIHTANTARFELPAGSATVGPMLLVSGTNLTTPINGMVEFNGTNLFFTRAGAVREGVLTQSAVTTEAVVSDTTITVNIGGVNYKLLARA